MFDDEREERGGMRDKIAMRLDRSGDDHQEQQ